MKLQKLIETIRQVRTERIRSGDVKPWLTVNLNPEDYRAIRGELAKQENNTMEAYELAVRKTVYGVSVTAAVRVQVPQGEIHVYSIRDKQLIAKVSFTADLDHPDYFKG